MRIIFHWLISTLAVIVTSYLLPGVHVDSLLAAFVTALVIGIINTTLRPVLLVLTFPLTFLTLGLFALVINAIMVMLTSLIVPGFRVDNFWWALLFGLILSIVNWFLHRLSK